MAPEEVYEIRVRPTDELSPQAQREVNDKLAAKDAAFQRRYKGYAKITYVSASPLTVKSVDPIEGDFATLFASIMNSTRRTPPAASA